MATLGSRAQPNCRKKSRDPVFEIYSAFFPTIYLLKENLPSRYKKKKYVDIFNTVRIEIISKPTNIFFKYYPNFSINFPQVLPL